MTPSRHSIARWFGIILLWATGGGIIAAELGAHGWGFPIGWALVGAALLLARSS